MRHSAQHGRGAGDMREDDRWRMESPDVTVADELAAVSSDESDETGEYTERRGRRGGSRGRDAAGGRPAARSHGAAGRSAGAAVAGILAEILFTLAGICALYIVWQMWWTGVQAEHTQMETRASANWVMPAKGDGTKIAKAQAGDPPVQPTSAKEGELIAQVIIPRFGHDWRRNLVQGTSLTQLNKHGLGHYTSSQMPGQVGNFAFAGHRNGYGQPLGDVDKLQQGDPIVVRTKDYWYIYHYTDHEIVLPSEVRVIAPDPHDPGAAPTKRLLTMTTCEPKYTTPTHRWISYGEFSYWAKVSDGIPKELADSAGHGATVFSDKESSPIVRMKSLIPAIIVAAIVYAVLFLAALAAWRFPVLRDIRDGVRPRPQASIYGWLLRHQPGVLPIRIVMVLVLAFIAAASLFQWGFPWAAWNIPALRAMSNFTAV